MPAPREVWAPPSSPRSSVRWGRNTKATGTRPAPSPQQARGCWAETRPPLHSPPLLRARRSGPRAPSPDRHRAGVPTKEGAQGAQGLRRSGGGPLLHRHAGPAPPPLSNRTLFVSPANGLAPLLCFETPQGSLGHARPRFTAVRGSSARPPEAHARARALAHRVCGDACTRARRPAARSAFPSACSGLRPPSAPPAGVPARPKPARDRRHRGTAAVTKTLAPRSQ